MVTSTTTTDATYRQAFDRDGFVMVSGLFDSDTITRVRRFIYFAVCHVLPDSAHPWTGDAATSSEPWESKRLDDWVRAAQRDEPSLFEAFYDTLQNGAVLTRLLSAPQVLDTVARLLGEDVDGLALSGAQLRVDVPRDPRNGYEWHQERAYYPQNPEGHRGLVLSIALQDTPPSLGALRVVPTSHRRGFTFGQHSVTTNGVAEQKALSPDQLVGAEVRATDFKRGDALFTSMNTYHRAGENHGERVRFSLLGRYHQLAADPHYVATRARLDANPLLKARAEAVHGALF
ncbi:MAG: phytanoyl-CoA dioxygenase family protein [Polyangiales bacterium]